MKNIKRFVLQNKGLALGIFATGIVTATLVNAAYTRVSPSDDLVQINQEETYGAMGFGRGNGQSNAQLNGQGNSEKQGTGKNSQTSQNTTNNQGLNKDNCLMDGCLLVDDAEYPASELSQETIGFLQAALADERKALTTYEATMEKFGNVRPFINIARAEEQHISMLKALFDKYGVEIPSDTTIVGSLPATLPEVCAVGVQAEIDNDQLYQDMISSIQEQDIKQVFTSLASASLNMHLPAFEKCAN